MIKNFLSITESLHHILRGEKQNSPQEAPDGTRCTASRRVKGEGTKAWVLQTSALRATTCRIPRVPVHTSLPLFSPPVLWAWLQWAEQRVVSHPPLATDGALQGVPSTAWERSHHCGRAAGGGYQSPKELRDHGILQPSGQFLSHAH